MTPTTEAGRVLLEALPLDEWHPINREIVTDHILTVEAEAVALTLAACQEHLGCACGDIKGHLATRGLIFKKVTA